MAPYRHRACHFTFLQVQGDNHRQLINGFSFSYTAYRFVRWSFGHAEEMGYRIVLANSEYRFHLLSFFCLHRQTLSSHSLNQSIDSPVIKSMESECLTTYCNMSIRRVQRTLTKKTQNWHASKNCCETMTLKFMANLECSILISDK